MLQSPFHYKTLYMPKLILHAWTVDPYECLICWYAWCQVNLMFTNSTVALIMKISCGMVNSYCIVQGIFSSNN